MVNRATAVVWAGLMCAAGLAGGCGQGSGVASGARVGADEYAGAFQSARDALRDARLTLDRVDATQGVITTRPTAEPGAAKPWSAAWGARAAGEDLVQRQQRTVQVAFVAADAGSGDAEPGPGATGTAAAREIIPPADAGRDLLERPVETTMRVRVIVQRVQRPGRRVSSESVKLVTLSSDPALEEAGLAPAYLVDVGDDQEMAAAILRDILQRMAGTRGAQTAKNAEPAPEPETPVSPAAPAPAGETTAPQPR